VFSGKRFLFTLHAPSPLPLTRPISSSLREVSTWRFRKQITRSKKTPALQAMFEVDSVLCYYLVSLPIKKMFLKSCEEEIKQFSAGRQIRIIPLVIFADIPLGGSTFPSFYLCPPLPFVATGKWKITNNKNSGPLFLDFN